MAQRRSGISSARDLLYDLARVLGDVNAVQKGTVGKRIARRVVSRAAGRALWKLFN